MLLLSRKKGQTIVIDEKIVITVVSIQRHKVMIGIEAPKEALILRGELKKKQGE